MWHADGFNCFKPWKVRTSIKLRKKGKTLTEEKNDKKHAICVFLYLPRKASYFFIFILDAKRPKVTYIKLEKKLTFS